MSKWEPSYNGEPRPGNRTFALAQLAIDRGWNPAGHGKALSCKFFFFIDEQYIEMKVRGYAGYDPTIRLNVSDFIFNKKFAKALVGAKKYRKLLQGAVLSRSPVDYMYREAIDKTAKIGTRI